MRLSVLDTMPLRADQDSADALSATVALAKAADRFGYERFWVSEHHSSPFVSTTPSTILGVLGARTERIRVGSGAVLLPNHSPFRVAEEFAALEAAFPGRVDLGLGRAPGGDLASILALRDGAPTDAGQFPTQVQTLQAMLDPAGVPVRVHGRTAQLVATPAARSLPLLWILGSSSQSAVLAAELGMPFVFGQHVAGSGPEQALEIYRSRFRPSEGLSQPRAIVSVNVALASTEEQATRLALPHALALVGMMRGAAERQMLVEDAEDSIRDTGASEAVKALTRSWFIGEAGDAHLRLEGFARTHGLDEIMVYPVSGVFRGSRPDRSDERIDSLALLSDEAGLTMSKVAATN